MTAEVRRFPENSNTDTERRFWIVISGHEVARVTKAGANQEMQEVIRRVRERRGLVYVCQSDLTALRLKTSDLLNGVEAVQGFNVSEEQEVFPPKQDSIVFPENHQQARLILRTCAERAVPQPTVLVAGKT